MDYWTGVLKIPLTPTSTSDCKVAVPLCLSTASKTLALHADKDDDVGGGGGDFRTSTVLDPKEKGGVFTNTNKEMA
ncbi:hypothetical protein D5086_025633 [Populus alba]|uniref:Uncharacterized protein n=1 Tax=Populus alba TaxID=43335 RepID=A0ACC4B059_POPAL